MSTFFIKTFGCRVNQVESQALREEFLRAGFTPALTPEKADICLLNTCSVTHQADKDAEKLIRQLLRRNPNGKLILTGCYAATHKERIKYNFPQAQVINKTDLGHILFGCDMRWIVTEHEGHSRAFIKIQDGCDNFCSYCLVPYARPEKRSKPLSDILKEIALLVQKNFLEIVLTGINIGNYKCPQTNADLAALCEQIARMQGHFRIRFSSIELPTVTDGIIDVMAKYPARFCNYFHLPLQAGCDKILKDMNRHYTTADYTRRVQTLRGARAQMGIFADVIAGYPTETAEDFLQTYRFIESLHLSGLHVFSYSPRPNTPAAQLPQVKTEEIKRRADLLRALDKKLRVDFADSLVGTTQEVFVEEHKDGALTAITSNFQPVILENTTAAKGLLRAKILRTQNGICFGVIL